MKHWQMRAADDSAARLLSKELKLPLSIARALVARGQGEPSDAAAFLDPKLAHCSDPALLPGLSAAVKRILQALARKEKIAIYGDYDVDGVTSTALVVRVLRALGGLAEPFLPHRMDEGYGLSLDGFQRCVDELHPNLVITVDCGTGSVPAVRKATELGIDVIVTDHHTPPAEIAPALAVINPKLGAPAELQMLAGVGVAFKLCHGLVKAARSAGLPGAEKVDLRDYLDLVAVGTIADIVPLKGENRILASHGLRRLNDAGNPGFRALLEASGTTGRVDGYEVGFRIGPRLNASGRLGSAMQSLELLLTDLPPRALDLAQMLDKANRERQEIEARIVEEAVKELDSTFDPVKTFAMIVAKTGWHPGVVGIVASRLVSRYCRPAIVIAITDEGVGRGSCRSIEGFDVVAHLQRCGDLLKKFGGHVMAAGLEIERDAIEGFRERFNALAADTLRGRDLRPALLLDGWLEPQEVDDAFVRAQESMRPFGAENPAPVWAMRGVELAGSPQVLKKNTLKLSLKKNGTRLEAVGFGMGEREIPSGLLDVAFQVKRDSFRGVERISYTLQDIRPSE